MHEEHIAVDEGGVDAAALWTAVHGSGPPMLLCHGGPGLWDDLDVPARMVDDLVTVHRFDQRGCGRSRDAGPYSVERAIADIAALREHWGIERWIVGGHSWGACLALAYALKHPARVAAVVWIAGTGVDDYWEREARHLYHDERAARLTSDQRARYERLREMQARTSDDAPGWNAIDEELCILQWLPDFADRERAPDHAAALLRAGFRPNYHVNAALNADWLRYRQAEDLGSRLASLDIPALVVHGAEDPRPSTIAERLAAALPRADLAVIPGAGHYPWVEQPDRFRDVLRRFLVQAAGGEIDG